MRRQFDHPAPRQQSFNALLQLREIRILKQSRATQGKKLCGIARKLRRQQQQQWSCPPTALKFQNLKLEQCRRCNCFDGPDHKIRLSIQLIRGNGYLKLFVASKPRQKRFSKQIPCDKQNLVWNPVHRCNPSLTNDRREMVKEQMLQHESSVDI